MKGEFSFSHFFCKVIRISCNGDLSTVFSFASTFLFRVTRRIINGLHHLRDSDIDIYPSNENIFICLCKTMMVKKTNYDWQCRIMRTCTNVIILRYVKIIWKTFFTYKCFKKTLYNKVRIFEMIDISTKILENYTKTALYFYYRILKLN